MILEYDDVIFAVGRQLRELARSSTVLLYARHADRGLQALLLTANLVVGRYDERLPMSTV